MIVIDRAIWNSQGSIFVNKRKIVMRKKCEATKALFGGNILYPGNYLSRYGDGRGSAVVKSVSSNEDVVVK